MNLAPVSQTATQIGILPQSWGWHEAGVRSSAN